MKLNFAGHDLILHHAGVLLWPRYRTLIVSDLHLEKGSHYARKGYFLPPYDSHETLTRLLRAIQGADIGKIIILGDCFHDADGFHRLGKIELGLFDRLRQFQPVWIKGNHDGDYVPDGFQPYTEYISEGLVFCHQARPEWSGHEISGHFHPKADIIHKGAIISRPCFVTDERRVMLPAFGAYTGDLSAESEAIRTLFPSGFRLHALGRDRIFTL